MNRGEALYRLQQLDSERDAKQDRLAEIQAALKDNSALRQARQAAEKAEKRALKWQTKQRDLELEITREAAEQRWQPLLARTREALQAALAAPAGGQTVDEVLLIGGTSLIPCVQRTVGQGFGRPIEIPEHADVVVTAGAAMLAHTLGAERLSPGR